MTKQQESEILTRVGPGTPMGNVLRHYWYPALKSSELVPDGAPVRFLLLGEQLIAFRDTRGRVGIMDHLLTDLAQPSSMRVSRIRLLIRIALLTCASVKTE